MEILGKIRRLYWRDKLSLHEIAKRTGLSRNTIRSWLRKAEAAAPPTYRRGQVPHRLTAFHAALEQALKADSHRTKQNRRTAKALLAQIKADGYGGGYSQLTAFIRAWRGREGKAPHAFVPLQFALGEAFQFDWSEEGLVIGGIYRRLQVSHLKLCASRAFWLVAYPSQGHEMLFDAHTRSFTALGGVARRGYFLQDDAALQGSVLRILVRAVEHCLRAHSPGCSAAARLGAVAFIHRFGSALNAHLHFHCCILDGVFESATTTDGAAGVVFRPARGLDAAAVHPVQARVRQQVLRAFVRRGLLEHGDAEEMGGWDHGGGFSLDASVRVEGADRAGLERLLRYCARPPFALAHLQEHDAGHLLYRCPKPRPGGPSALVLTPLALIGKIAALVPPPRMHRHRYYGVLAPHAPLRAAVTALAPVPVPPPPPADPAGAQQASAPRAAARYLWAMLLARIYEVLPLTCPFCHASMRIIAFINDASAVRQILAHLGEATRPPRIAPARGPPLWEAATAAAASNAPAWDHTPPPAPEVEFDQRITW